MQKSKVIVVMPAYNAAATLEKTIADVPFECVDELILVDDASRDSTVETARAIAEKFAFLTTSGEEYTNNPDKVWFSIVTLPTNKGYGGNQKKCYELALSHEADIVVMLHPDYQYDPKLIKYFVSFIDEGYFDVMLGSRIRSRTEALAGGMPLYKYVFNRMLTLIENLATGRVLSDWHTGMRAYRREVLEKIPYQTFSDDFVFDTQALFAIIEHDYSIGEIPVPVKYFKEASSINFSRSMTYGLLTLRETVRHLFKKLI
jgi:glycosyltransferase involved in cell wall biosynthesis